MLTPEPTPLHPLSMADRFWSYGSSATGVEPDDVPEPQRSVLIVRQFLGVLDRLDATSPRKAAAALVAMLRQAELDGDLSYASPEQVRGEILDTRSVVFSLGVVLFERLTGRHPFGAENNRPRRIDRIRKGELGSGVNSFPTVAAGIRSVLVKAMSPFSEERWPDLRQIRELLTQFVHQESPSPRLPGTEPAASEDTRVVRLATDFGRELMQVVSRHDRAITERPIDEAPRARTSQRLSIPTSGLSSISGGTAAANTVVRRPTQATPRAGVVLRPLPAPEPPPGDSVVTRVHQPMVDPLGATQSLKVDEVAIAARIDAQLAEDSQPTIAAPRPSTAPVPVASPAPAPSPALAAMAPSIARTRAPRPTPRPPAAATPRSAADTRASLAASLTSLPPLPSPPTPSWELPLPAPPESFANLGARIPRGRSLVLAGIGAVIGATAALALYLSLGSAPPTATASSVASVTAPAPTLPATSPSATLTPPAPAPAPAAALAPEEIAAPAPITLEDQLGEALAPCVVTAAHPRPRVFGLSLLYRFGAVSKPYFAAGDGLSPTEHGCIAKILHGVTFVGAPTSKVAEYKVRVADGAVKVTFRATH